MKKRSKKTCIINMVHTPKRKRVNVFGNTFSILRVRACNQFQKGIRPVQEKRGMLFYFRLISNAN